MFACELELCPVCRDAASSRAICSKISGGMSSSIPVCEAEGADVAGRAGRCGFDGGYARLEGVRCGVGGVGGRVLAVEGAG